MKQSPLLAALANDLVQALPKTATDLRLYISDLGMFHLNELRQDQISARPNPMPYYGDAFKNALLAIENGWVTRVAYHQDRVAAAVRRAGGALSEVRRVERPIGNVPQPTSRKDWDSGRVPRDGK